MKSVTLNSIKSVTVNEKTDMDLEILINKHFFSNRKVFLSQNSSEIIRVVVEIKKFLIPNGDAEGEAL